MYCAPCEEAVCNSVSALSLKYLTSTIFGKCSSTRRRATTMLAALSVTMAANLCGPHLLISSMIKAAFKWHIITHFYT